MKTITITITTDKGEELYRNYYYEEPGDVNWDYQIKDMLDTLEKSDKPFKEIPGFEGTTDKLNEL